MPVSDKISVRCKVICSIHLYDGTAVWNTADTGALSILSFPRGCKPTFGDVFKHMVTMENGKYRNIVLGSKFIANGLQIGRDILLSDIIEDDVVMYVGSIIGTAHNMIRIPYEYWESGKDFPPCENYWGEEPLNLGLVGQYLDNTKCGCCDQMNGTYLIEHDNSHKNMVILNYGNGVKIGYNKHMLVKHFQYQMANNQFPTDPRTRKELKISDMYKIAAGGNFAEIVI